LLDELEDELPSPCENVLEELLVAALPLESVAVEASPEVADEELLESALLESPWLSVPGPDPVRPGIVCAVVLGLDAEPDADEETAPSVMFVPVARKEERIVGSLPSTTVLFVPASLL
jgi:hypothetical protein